MTWSTSRTGVGTDNRGWVRWLVGATSVLVLVPSTIAIGRPDRGPGRAGAAILVSIGLVALAIEPLGAGLAIAIIGLGRLVD